MKIAIIYSNYYPEITQNLIESFKLCFEKSDFKVEYEMYEVFGVSEIPFCLSRIPKDCKAFAVFGCVVEGETFHHELINRYVFDKLYDYSIETKLPLGYGILNVKNYEQAVERSRLDEFNRGIEAFNAISYLL